MATSYKYEIKYGLCRIYEVISNDDEIIVPSTIEGYNVFQICSGAFFDLKVRRIILPNTIGKIDNYAFVNLENLEYFECYNIEDLQYPFDFDVENVFVFSHSFSVSNLLEKNYKFKDIKYEKDLKWEIINEKLKTARITGFNVRYGKLILPDFIDGYKIIELTCLIKTKKEVSFIKFPKYLKNIPDKFAFRKGEVFMVLPEELCSIGDSAFYDTFFLNEKLIFPKTLKSIGKYAFYKDSFFPTEFEENFYKTKFIFNSNKLSINEESFAFRTVSFSKDCNINFLNKKNFFKCNIDSIYFHPENKTLNSFVFSGCFINKLYGFENLKYLNAGVFFATNFTQKEFNLENVLILGPSCFQFSNINKVFIPKHLKLSENCFSHSSLQKVIFDKEYLDNFIPSDCFSCCNLLETINLPPNITIIGQGAFEHCLSLRKINLENIKDIRAKAFCNSNLQDAKLVLKNIENISNAAFFSTKIKEISILSEKIYTIPPNCFSICENLLKVKISKSINTLGSYSFFKTKALKNFDFKNVSTIEKYSFESSGIVDIDLNKVSVLDEASFDNCLNLEKVRLGKKINILPKYVFRDCKSLKSLDVSNILAFKEECLARCDFDFFEFSENTRVIDFKALYHCKIKKLIFRQNVSDLKRGLLWNVLDLESIYIDFNGVIPPCFVYYNRTLKQLIFSEKVKKIDVGTIYSNNNLSEAIFLNPDIEISSRNFLNCKNLTTIYIDNEKTFKKISSKKSNNITIRKDIKDFSF